MSRVKKAVEKAKAAREQNGTAGNERKSFFNYADNQIRPDDDAEAKPSRRPTIVISTRGALILLLIAISSFAFGINEKMSRYDMDAMQARFERLEKETKVFQNIFMGIATLEGQIKEMQAVISESDKSFKHSLASLSTEVQNLKSTRSDGLKSGEFYALNTTPAAMIVKPQPAKKVIDSPPSVAVDVTPAAKKVRVAKKGDGIKRSNMTTKDGYHEVCEGETLYRISVNYGVSVDDLCRINKIDPKRYIIHPGQKILVASR